MKQFLFFCLAACALIACTSPQGTALTESEVSAFAIEFHAGLTGFDDAIPVWQDGLLPSSSYFNAGMSEPATVNLDDVDGSWFWEDSLVTDVKSVEIYGDAASVYGTVTYYDFGMGWSKNFHGIVKRDGNRLVWHRWMESRDGELARNWMGIETESDKARQLMTRLYWAAVDADRKGMEGMRDSILAEDPGMALAHIGEVNMAFLAGDGEAYRAAVQAAVDLCDEENPATCAYLRSLHSDHGDRVANAVLARAMAPDDPLLCINLAWRLAYVAEDLDGAILVLDQALDRWPTTGGLHNFMGYLQMANDDLMQAEKHFRMYVRLSPEVANAHDSMGDFLRKMERLEDAKASYAKALELDPDFGASAKKIEEIEAEQAGA